MNTEQKELFMQFLVIYKDLTKRVRAIKDAIPTEEEWKEEVKLIEEVYADTIFVFANNSNMSGRKKVVNRSIAEEELKEVEDILDDLDILLARMDQAAQLIDAMMAAA